MAKFKVTGIARILIFLLLFLPALFFGVSYAKGEDPIANLRLLFGMEEKTSVPDTTEEIDNVADLQRALKSAQAENKSLRKKLDACEARN